MPAVRGSFSSLLQGISRQPEELRFDSQASEQINMVSDTVNALSKRPSSWDVGRLTSINAGISQDYNSKDKWSDVLIGDKHYLVKVQPNGRVTAYDAITGDEIPVQDNFLGQQTGGRTYVSTEPHKDIKVVPVDNYALILNTKVEVEMADSVAGGTYRSSLHFSGAQWGTVLTIEIEDTDTNTTETFSLKMPSGVGRLVDSSGNPLSPPDPELDVSRLDPVAIRTIFVSMITGQFTNAIDTTVDATSIYLNPQYVVKSVSDGAKGRFLRHVGTSVTSVKDLPAFTTNNRVVQIRPSSSNQTGAYYVKFDSQNEVWNECPKPGSKHIIDSFTLPRCLIDSVDVNGNKILHMGQVSTIDNSQFPRLAFMGSGDDNTNPPPSFIGNKIEDVSVFKGRLGILSGNSMIFSSANDYWDFWFNSATIVTEADPIDVTISSGSLYRPNKLVVQGGDLLMLGDKAQFMVSGVDVLTPQSVSISKVGDYNMNSDTDVMPYGEATYYSDYGGGMSQVLSLINGSFNNTKGSVALTEHVGNYVESSVDKFAMSDVDSTLFIVTRDPETGLHGDKLYTYRTAEQAGKIVQKSWSHWEYPHGFRVITAYVLKGVLYVLTTDPNTSFVTSGKLFLIKHYLEEDLSRTHGVEASMDFLRVVQADSQDRVLFTRAYSGQVAVNLDGEVVRGPLTNVTGQAVNLKIFDSSKLTDYYLLGSPMKSTYSPTTPVVRDSKGIIDTTGHLMIHRYRVNYSKVGKVESHITSRFVDPYVQTDEATTESIQHLSLLSNASYMMSGIIQVPVLRNVKDLNFKIVSDDYRPMTITSIEWEGQYNKRRTGVV